MRWGWLEACKLTARSSLQLLIRQFANAAREYTTVEEFHGSLAYAHIPDFRAADGGNHLSVIPAQGFAHDA